jgi:hypothetical protein
MHEKILEPYSLDAADAADRLRLIKCDIRLVEGVIRDRLDYEDADREALTMHLRRMLGDVESLADDILQRDKAKREGGQT